MAEYRKGGSDAKENSRKKGGYENRPRILVVDDSEGIRGYLTNLLEVRGYAVTCAESGEQAISMLEESSVSADLVLLDIMMPGSWLPHARHSSIHSIRGMSA